jgi:TRAP-type C4-dicarboxylate transport system permease small subunit
MDALWNGLTRVARTAIVVGFSLLLFAAFVVTAEVMVRKAIPDTIELVSWLVGRLGGNMTGFETASKVWIRDTLTFSGSDEISGYLFAIGTSWSMAYVLITRGHVRIDVLYGRLGPRLRAVLDIVALIFLTIFIGALLERAFNVASINFVEWNRSNTNLRVPLAWAQIPWMLGIALFFVTAVVAIIRSALALAQGDLAKVNATSGVPSQDEEIAGEVQSLGIEMRHEGKN